MIFVTIDPNDERWAIRTTDERGQLIPSEQAVRKLAASDERSFYGLLLSKNEETLFVTTDELLRLIEQWEHPMVRIEMNDAKTAQYVEQLRPIRQFLHDPAHFKAVHLTTDGSIAIDGVSPEEERLIVQLLHERFGPLLTDPIVQRPLLAHIRTYGIEPLRHDDPPLALRLQEPESFDEPWELSLAVVRPSGKLWSAPPSKRNVSIERALLKEWKGRAAAIEAEQQFITSLLPHVPEAPNDVLFFQTLTERDVQRWLQYDVPLLQAFDVPVVLPQWLKQLTATKMTAKTEVAPSYQSVASFDDIVSFDWTFSVGDETVTRAQFDELVREQRSFLQLNDRWFFIDPESLKRLQQLLSEAEEKEWTVRDLLLSQTPLQTVNDDEEEEPVLSFELHRQLQQFLHQFQQKEQLPHVPIHDALQTTLRPYQRDGVDWLLFMRSYGLGACLADDMGLGKTVQVIAYFLHVHDASDRPSLVICPTSVLGNWQKELETFAPSLRVAIHYGAGRPSDAHAFRTKVAEERPDVIVTTYGTATQDRDVLEEMAFETIVIDEAQNIKNMQTKQSRAIRSFTGTHHIALTGTPIENRLAELWSIFDFLLRGYFGSFHSFTTTYIAPIERDGDVYMKEQLQRKIEPFLLRRTKSDPSLQLDLPEKNEYNEYCPLTSEQAALYKAYVDETEAAMNEASPFEKKGLVLTMLNRLKQLCNHPAFFLKEPIDDLDEALRRSIKVQRIVERSAMIVEEGEQGLIFTQYIGMGTLLQRILHEKYGIDAPFLTGQTTKEERDELVRRFQRGEFPIFILSLHAGGTGLNLTAATYVLHADRWWNPAVENQATDRAYRIGQTKYVDVAKYVTLGTIEEKIDRLLREKTSLSNDLIQSSQWMAQLSDEDIRELITLE